MKWKSFFYNFFLPLNNINVKNFLQYTVKMIFNEMIKGPSNFDLIIYMIASTKMYYFTKTFKSFLKVLY